ncbi:MAG: ParM/StbA family protein, partial [Bacillota bacterium]
MRRILDMGGIDVFRAGVDVGYGYCKAVARGNRRVLFPSLVARHEGRKAFGLPGSPTGRLDYQVRLTGPRVSGSFAVGEAAMRKDTAVRAWDLKEQVAHQNTLVLLFTACVLVGASGDVELGIGLPLEVFVSAREQVKPWVEGASCQVAVGERPAVPVVFRRVSVFPQAGGAYLHALLREDGQVRDRSLLEAGVGVIDVGYRTTDLLLLARTGEGIVPDVDRCTTIDQGISAVHEYVWKVLQERLGEPVDIAWVERAFLWNRGVLT